MNPQRLVQRPVERGVVVAELLPQLLLLLGVSEVGGGASTRSSPEAGGRRGTKRPRRPASGPRPPCGRTTFSQAPPPGARGLAWASLSTGPTRVAGRRHRGSPPPSDGSCRRERAPAAPPRPPPIAPPRPRAPAAALRPPPPTAPQWPPASDAPPQPTSPATPLQLAPPAVPPPSAAPRPRRAPSAPPPPLAAAPQSTSPARPRGLGYVSRIPARHRRRAYGRPRRP
jgi:hypothetical protein